MNFEHLLKAHERFAHREHQLVGIEQLVLDVDLGRTAEHAGVVYRREIPKAFALLDEVGAGKTKQVVDAGQILYLQQQIDTVIPLVPGFARSTWASSDPMLGEVAKHAWASVPNIVHEFHAKYDELDFSASGLHWIVSNYEFIRRPERLDALIRQLKGRRTWLVIDESWCVKANSLQTRAVLKLRNKRADRVTILNGTPLSDGKPLDLFYQFAILDPGIIGCKNKTHFRSKYCIMGGFAGRNVVDYKNLEELNARIAPYVLSRRTRDCFDLPPMLPPVTIEAKLDEPTWKLYREMRDDLVTWFDGQASVSKQAIVKILRLEQITSGYLGGLEDVDPTNSIGFHSGGASPNQAAVMPTTQPMPQWLRRIHGIPDEDPTVRSQAPAQSPQAVAGSVQCAGPAQQSLATVTREIGREKLDAFLFWLKTLEPLPPQLLVWCRFRLELERVTKELERFYPQVLQLKGGQAPEDRAAAKALLAPGGLPRRGAVVGNQKAGGASLNFSAANIAVYMSNSPALIERTQSIGRIERPGATQPMLIVDVVATGPKGQKTINHHTLKALRAKEDMARYTVAEWRRILKEE